VLPVFKSLCDLLNVSLHFVKIASQKAKVIIIVPSQKGHNVLNFRFVEMWHVYTKN
jgi:hypothetical protein